MAVPPAGHELLEAAIQGGPPSHSDEGCLRFQLQQQQGLDDPGSLSLPGQWRITNCATMRACFCQALTKNSGSLPKNGIKPGRQVLAVNQRGDITLCQLLPSHGALASSGATPAALALVSIPTAAATADTDHCFHLWCSVSVPAVITPTSTFYVRFLATQDRTNSIQEDIVICCV